MMVMAAMRTVVPVAAGRRRRGVVCLAHDRQTGGHANDGGGQGGAVVATVVAMVAVLLVPLLVLMPAVPGSCVRGSAESADQNCQCQDDGESLHFFILMFCLSFPSLKHGVCQTWIFFPEQSGNTQNFPEK